MKAKMAIDQPEDVTDTAGRALWKVSSKLHGIAELFRNQHDDVTISDMGTLGVGMLLTDLATEVMAIQEALEGDGRLEVS